MTSSDSIEEKEGYTADVYNQNMNINADNAEKLFVEGGVSQEAPQEQRDPIEELNPIQLLKKPGTSCLSLDEFK